MARVIEQRKERRIKVDLPVTIIYRNSEVNGKAENISRLGAYVKIGRHIPAGSDLDITLKIPVYAGDASLSGEVKSKASVFRSGLAGEIGPQKYYGIGIFFTKFLQQADRDRLSRYIDFLILQESKGIHEGLKRWKEKREISKKSMEKQRIKIKDDNYQAQTLELLKQALARLEEIYRLIKPQNTVK